MVNSKYFITTLSEMKKEMDWSEISLSEAERKALLSQFAQAHKYTFVDRIEGPNPDVYVFRVTKES